MMRRCLTTLSVLVMLLALTAPAFAQTVLFGPKTYTRTVGPPNQFTDTFTLPAGTTAPYTLHVVNGNTNGTNRISSATVTLNSAQILGPSDFGQNIAVIDRTVTLQASNTLEIRLTSAPGSFITISVLDTSAGTQPTALTPNPLNLAAGATGTLTATLAPAPTAAGTLAVSSVNTVVATVPASVPFAAGQTSVPFPVTAVASGSTAVTVTLNGGSAASQVTVTPPPPTITSFTPLTGVIGTIVTITGTNFTAGGAGATTVKFNGKLAILTTLTATSLTATVPQGATNGSITVTTSGGTATSPQPFTVQNALDFTLMPLPGTGSVAHVGTTTYQVKINDAGPSAYTGFVSLNVSGLPAGVTATFTPPQATVSQPSTLLLTSTATAVPGTYPLLIAGSGTTDGGIIQRTAQAQLTILPARASTLSGRVLAAKDGGPIAGVTVKVNALIAVTDAGGNFLFPNVPVGPQIAFVDGETASNAQVLYPIVPIPVTIVTGQDNHLPWTAYLHEMS